MNHDNRITVNLCSIMGSGSMSISAALSLTRAEIDTEEYERLKRELES